jgi:hypothetical protein
VVYTILVWANLAVVRAAIMSEMTQFAHQPERRQDELKALLITSGVMALTNPPEWIANLQPQIALLSVAPGDRRGMPADEMIEALEGATILRTDRNGWIELATDGEQIWVEAAR